MSQSQHIRRHPDGSIDLDFYRAGATALRRQAMREARTLRTVFRFALAKFVILGLAIGLLSLGPRSQNQGTAELRASNEEPMQLLRDRAERIRLQLVNTAGNTAVH